MYEIKNNKTFLEKCGDYLAVRHWRALFGVVLTLIGIAGIIISEFFAELQIGILVELFGAIFILAPLGIFIAISFFEEKQYIYEGCFDLKMPTGEKLRYAVIKRQEKAYAPTLIMFFFCLLLPAL